MTHGEGGSCSFSRRASILPTWLTLDELDDNHPMWDQMLHEDAVVIEPEYLEYKRTGDLPPTWRAESAGRAYAS